jgi:radical SAM family uncharacterized protein/radical SAM-linked protein
MLRAVRRPTRYIGGEVGLRVKDHRAVDLTFALAFPDVYEVGMSHLGFQTVHHLINARPDVACERTFSPWGDLEAQLRSRGLPLVSLETQTPLGEFDVIGFSLAYELGYTNVLVVLDLGGIPLRSAERTGDHPIVLAGGVAAYNPEPLADFIDAFFLGEAEDGMHPLIDALIEAKRRGSSRAEALAALARVPGVYVPSLYEAAPDGSVRPLGDAPARIRRQVTPELRFGDALTRPLTPLVRLVHDRLSVEVARGCTQGCRFCQAGMIYRPVRERRPEEVLALVDTGLAATGFDEVSLLSLSTGDYRALPRLLPTLMDRTAGRKVALSLPSLRAATLTPEIMAQIKRVRKTGFTLAPEAATQRLRDVINKKLTEAELIETTRAAFEAGWNQIKLYFMIGLPTEDDQDRAAIADLCRRLLGEARAHNRGARLNVSVALFVPKPHTPFQWAAQLDLDQAQSIREKIRRDLPRRGVKMGWSAGPISFLEGVFARGDRRLGPVLGRAFDLGCRFDGWTDQIRFDLWQEAFNAEGIDPAAYLAARDPGKNLPWDHLEVGVSREFLAAEMARAQTGQSTPDCRDGECQDCGVCDFETLEPIVFPDWRPESGPAVRSEAPDAPSIRYRFEMTKEGPARYWGHLEFQEAVSRTLRRAELRVRYSQGYHPLPRISLSPALPVGIESVCEAVVIEFPAPPPAVGQVIDRFNQNAPDGIRLLSGRPVTKKRTDLTPAAGVFRLSTQGGLDRRAAAAFLERDREIVVRPSPKGDKEVDLRRQITDVRFLSDTTVEIEVDLTKGHPRIEEILDRVFQAPEEAAATARLVKVSVGYP